MKIRLFFILFAITIARPATAQINIWEGTSCKARVTLTPILPEGKPVASVIVCPGGSYYWHDTKSEGIAVANWLADNGIAAYILNYRVAGVADHLFAYRAIFRGNRHPDMICDLQRSIELVREQYDGPVGAMGFSAGGHLVLSSGSFAGTNFLERYGIEPEVSLVPDFIAAIYPVVTMSEERYVHKRSRNGVMGRSRVHDISLRDSLSLEKHVNSRMPPVFLLNCRDDDVVDYHNSELMDSALTASGVLHKRILYETGGHGFGANTEKLNPETSEWQEKFLPWLDTIVLRQYGYRIQHSVGN